MSLPQTIIDHFQQKFGEMPAFVVRAPGRVNIIGEHTDYNDGFVLPMAINRAIWIALRPRTDQTVMIHSLDFEETSTFTLDSLQRGPNHWIEYVKGMTWVLQESGYALTGWEGVMAGDIPIGASLSSSAGLELATARAFSSVSGWVWEPKKMAQLGQQTENQWIGVNCGIMDQMISATGQANHALLIDCRSLEIEPVPLPPGSVVVVLDTMMRRGLVDSAYNERREQCEAAARFFGVPALRDVTLQAFEKQASQLDDLTRRRARHVISENERTLEAVQAMREGDAARLGYLMNESHRSLLEDFEVCGDGQHIMVQIAQRTAGCIGARMTGGGFGGCSMALVESVLAENFAKQVAQAYHEETGLKPNVYVCEATNGAEVIA